MKRMFSMLISLVMVLSMVCSVYAGSSRYYSYITTLLWVGDDSKVVDVYDKTEEKYITPASVKSSKKSVVKITKETYEDGTYEYRMTPKKAGKATLKIKFKAGTKTKTIKKKITVKKYPKEIESLSVNGESVDIAANKFYYVEQYAGSAARIDLTLKKGWTIDSTSGFKYPEGDGMPTEFNVTEEMLSGEESIPFDCSTLYIGILMRNSKYEYINYYIELDKPPINTL